MGKIDNTKASIDLLSNSRNSLSKIVLVLAATGHWSIGRHATRMAIKPTMVHERSPQHIEKAVSMF